MKTLKKGKKYTKVSPLPRQWFGRKEVEKATNAKGKYRESFRELNTLLSDGWKFCAREEYRRNLKKSLDKTKKGGILKV